MQLNFCVDTTQLLISFFCLYRITRGSLETQDLCFASAGCVAARSIVFEGEGGVMEPALLKMAFRKVIAIMVDHFVIPSENLA